MSEQNLVNPSVHRKLSRLRTALHLRLLGEGIGWLLLAMCTALLASFTLDYMLRLDDVALRAAIMIIAGLAVLVVLVRTVVLPQLVSMETDALALLVERRHGVLSDRLISMLQLTRRDDHDQVGTSRAMIARVGQELEQIVDQVDFGDVVETDRLRRVLLGAILLTGSVIALIVWQSGLFSIWYQRNILFDSSAFYPQQTYLEVQGGPEFFVHRGENLEVLVKPREDSSFRPESITLHRQFGELLGTDPVPYNPDRGAYVLEFKTVSKEFEFYVTGGDDKRDRQNPHPVRILETAELTALEFEVFFPAYQNQTPASRVYPSSTERIHVPAGSDVLIRGELNLPIRSAELHLNGWPVGRVAAPTDEQLSRKLEANFQLSRFNLPGFDSVVGDLVVSPAGSDLISAIESTVRAPAMAAASVARGYGKSHELAITLTDEKGYSRVAQRYPVRLQLDQGPEFRKFQPQQVGTSVTPIVQIPMLVDLVDDYDLTSIQLQTAINDGAWVDFRDPIEPLPKDSPVHAETHVIDLAMLAAKAQPGDTLKIRAVAIDNLPDIYGGPNRTISPVRTFSVVSTSELEAELIRRIVDAGQIFQQGITNQGESLNKTTAANREITQTNAVSVDARQKLADSSAIQKAVGTDVENFVDKLSGITTEMRRNGIGSPEQLDLLTRGVIEPLQGQIPKQIDAAHRGLRDTVKLDDPRALADQTAELRDLQTDIQTKLMRLSEQAFKFADRQQLIADLSGLIKTSEEIKELIEKYGQSGGDELFEP